MGEGEAMLEESCVCVYGSRNSLKLAQNANAFMSTNMKKRIHCANLGGSFEN